LEVGNEARSISHTLPSQLEATALRSAPSVCSSVIVPLSSCRRGNCVIPDQIISNSPIRLWRSQRGGYCPVIEYKGIRCGEEAQGKESKASQRAGGCSTCHAAEGTGASQIITSCLGLLGGAGVAVDCGYSHGPRWMGIIRFDFAASDNYTRIGPSRSGRSADDRVHSRRL
jgi:hypothetical protein